MKRVIYFFAIILLITSGCKKELDINQNPNNATDESITANLLLPRVQQATAARMATQYDWTGRWMGYWARSGTYGPSAEEESYRITTSFEAGQWTGWYDILFDVNTMEQKAEAAGQDFYLGAAKIMKTIGFMYLVDMYNNVPYSQAFDLNTNIQPAYENGEDIYDSLLVSLDEGIALMQNADLLNVQQYDIMFGQDENTEATNWIKLANTQRLKLLLRMSQVPGFDPSSELAKIDMNIGFIGSGETVEVQPGYSVSRNSDNVSQQNPYWDAYKLTYNNQVADQYNRANNFVLDLYGNNGDPRYEYVFSQAATPVQGILYYGYNYGEVLPNSWPWAQANSSNVAGPGLAKSATQPQWLFSSVESMFLQAEAIQRGWIPGDAEAAYRNAVIESFMWLGVDDDVAAAEGYLDQENAISDWSQSTGNTAKINLIITQKYLALCGLNNFEAWVDYRRIGIPAVPQSLAVSVGSNHIPLRLRYPQAEYNYNAANVGAQNNPDPQTEGVFWDK